MFLVCAVRLITFTPSCQTETAYLQVKPQVLSLLKEVVQNEFPHKVWIQGVVDHLGSPKLHKKWKYWITCISVSESF